MLRSYFGSNVQKSQPQKVKNGAFRLTRKAGAHVINNEVTNDVNDCSGYTLHLMEHLVGYCLSELSILLSITRVRKVGHFQKCVVITKKTVVSSIVVYDIG